MISQSVSYCSVLLYGDSCVCQYFVNPMSVVTDGMRMEHPPGENGLYFICIPGYDYFSMCTNTNMSVKLSIVILGNSYMFIINIIHLYLQLQFLTVMFCNLQLRNLRRCEQLLNWWCRAVYCCSFHCCTVFSLFFYFFSFISDICFSPSQSDKEPFVNMWTLWWCIGQCKNCL